MKKKNIRRIIIKRSLDIISGVVTDIITITIREKPLQKMFL